MTTPLRLSSPTVYGADRVGDTSWSEPVEDTTLPASCSEEPIIRFLLPGRSGWRSPALFRDRPVQSSLRSLLFAAAACIAVILVLPFSASDNYAK